MISIQNNSTQSYFTYRKLILVLEKLLYILNFLWLRTENVLNRKNALELKMTELKNLSSKIFYHSKRNSNPNL